VGSGQHGASAGARAGGGPMTTPDTLTLTRTAAAATLGVCGRTLLRWEAHRRAGHPDYESFPAVPRRAHSGHRLYTPDVLAAIRAWANRTV